jgi:hypothetical protein
MRRTKDLTVRVPVTEHLVRFLVCKRIKATRGQVLSIKVGDICAEIYPMERSPQTCRAKVKRILLDVLGDAVIHELTNRKHIVVYVSKAKELLRCEEYEN